jgi:hypothetical protein
MVYVTTHFNSNYSNLSIFSTRSQLYEVRTVQDTILRILYAVIQSVLDLVNQT